MPEIIRGLFGYAERPNFPPRYNIAPTQPVAIVRRSPGKPGSREFALVRWGLIPSWAKEVSSKPLINARSETVITKPTFRGPFRRRRCLVPADGYYEWWRGGDGRPQPYLFTPSEGGVFAMAAVWEDWLGPDGSELESMAILTREASPDLAHIHHRMPCIIRPADFDAWLDGRETEPEAALDLALGPNAGAFTPTPVSTAVNRVANDGPELQEPVPADQPADPPPEPEQGPDTEQLRLI